MQRALYLTIPNPSTKRIPKKTPEMRASELNEAHSLLYSPPHGTDHNKQRNIVSYAAILGFAGSYSQERRREKRPHRRGHDQRLRISDEVCPAGGFPRADD